MKKPNLHKHIQDPIMLTAMFMRLRKEYVEKGFKEKFADLHVAVILSFSFAGRKNLSNFEIGNYSQIVLAIVNAVMWSRN